MASRGSHTLIYSKTRVYNMRPLEPGNLIDSCKLLSQDACAIKALEQAALSHYLLAYSIMRKSLLLSLSLYSV